MSPAATHDVHRGALPFPRSLPEFQKLFPSDAACGAYLERCRWPELFRCPACGVGGALIVGEGLASDNCGDIGA